MVEKTDVVVDMPKIVWGIETSKEEYPRVILGRVEEALCWNLFSKYDSTNAPINRAFINVQASDYLTGQMGRAQKLLKKKRFEADNVLSLPRSMIN